MLPLASLSVLLISLTTASAGVVPDSKRSIHWGASKLVKALASAQVKADCGGEGSFLAEHKGVAICVSDATRVPVKGDKVCPHGWAEHKHEAVCLPRAEVSAADCGEGFSWDHPAKLCSENTHPDCKPGQWWHARSKTCIDDSWALETPTGTIPAKLSCPEGWAWHKDHQNCKPLTKRTYGPGKDCEWDSKKQCCDGGGQEPPQPSKGNGHGGDHGGGGKDHDQGHGHDKGDTGDEEHDKGDKGGGGGHGGSGGHKRDFNLRQQEVFPPSELDEMYCPDRLHACSVFTSGSSEWSWECIDPATELESCGGCASVGEGQDCTMIDHALSVGCELGVCAVYTCHWGFKPKGSTCVPT